VTLVELIVSIVVGSMVVGMTMSLLRLTFSVKTRRADQISIALDAREACDLIERLVNRAVVRGHPLVNANAGIRTFAGLAADRPTKGIHFMADLDDGDEPPLPGAPDGTLEWIWIWCDVARTQHDTIWPYDPRYPVKIAAFRGVPSGYAWNWTNENDASGFYKMVNHGVGAPANSLRRYQVIASNALNWSFAVDTTGTGGGTRVRLDAGFYVNHSDTYDPGWLDVCPAIATRPIQAPVFTVSRTFYPRSMTSEICASGGQWKMPSQCSVSQLFDWEINYVAWRDVVPKDTARLFVR